MPEVHANMRLLVLGSPNQVCVVRLPSLKTSSLVYMSLFGAWDIALDDLPRSLHRLSLGQGMQWPSLNSNVFEACPNLVSLSVNEAKTWDKLVKTSGSDMGRLVELRLSKFQAIYPPDLSLKSMRKLTQIYDSGLPLIPGGELEHLTLIQWPPGAEAVGAIMPFLGPNKQLNVKKLTNMIKGDADSWFALDEKMTVETMDWDLRSSLTWADSVLQQVQTIQFRGKYDTIRLTTSTRVLHGFATENELGLIKRLTRDKPCVVDSLVVPQLNESLSLLAPKRVLLVGPVTSGDIRRIQCCSVQEVKTRKMKSGELARIPVMYPNVQKVLLTTDGAAAEREKAAFQEQFPGIQLEEY